MIIEWNKVTWYSKLLAAILFVLAIPAWMFYMGMQWQKARGLEANFGTISNASQRPGFEISSYRCGDGSEFSLIYSVDKELIHILPASNIEIVPNIIVSSLPAGSRTRYEGGGVSLFIQGDNLKLTIGERPDVLNCRRF